MLHARTHAPRYGRVLCADVQSSTSAGASCAHVPPVAVVVPCADVYGSSFELRNAETVRRESLLNTPDGGKSGRYAN